MITPREACKTAADLIEQHGHHKGSYGDPGIGFCAAGAIWWALAGRMRMTVDATSEINAHFVGALDLLAPGPGGVAAWNDHPRTTKEAVIAELRRAATC